MKFQETESVELKRILNKDFAKEVVAFLNTRNGTIYIGVDDKGNVIGVDNVDKTMREVRQIIRDQILPSTEGLCEIESFFENEKIIIIIKIKKGSKLYYIKKEGRSATGCFYRDGTSSVPMSEEEIERQFMSSLSYKRVLLSEIPVNKNDLKFDTLRDKLRSNDVHINDSTFLSNFNLVTKDGNFNLLAELLSDENRVSIAVCVFKGKDKTEYLMRNEYGNKSLIQSYIDVINYCEAINPTYIDVSSRPRKEKRMFDNKAFEEAWINACVHNLWESHISPQIYIFEDRMEIESQGGLPYGLSKDEFLSGISKPVNPDLMDIFKSCRIVERSGHGVPEVVKVYGESAYKFSANTITVVIPFDKKGFKKDATLKKNANDTVNDTLNDTVNGTVNDTVNGTVNDTLNDTVNGTVNELELSKSEQLILNIISLDGNVTRNNICKQTNLSLRTVARVLNSLKSKKVIYRVGSDKNGQWKIVEYKKDDNRKNN